MPSVTTTRNNWKTSQTKKRWQSKPNGGSSATEHSDIPGDTPYTTPVRLSINTEQKDGPRCGYRSLALDKSTKEATTSPSGNVTAIAEPLLDAKYPATHTPEGLMTSPPYNSEL